MFVSNTGQPFKANNLKRKCVNPKYWAVYIPAISEQCAHLFIRDGEIVSLWLLMKTQNHTHYGQFAFYVW